jgi:hypothetical protein
MRGPTIGQVAKFTPEQHALLRTERMAVQYQHAIMEVGTHYGDLVRSLRRLLNVRAKEGTAPWGVPEEDWSNHPLSGYAEEILAELQKWLDELEPGHGQFGKWEEELMQLSFTFQDSEREAHDALVASRQAANMATEYPTVRCTVCGEPKEVPPSDLEGGAAEYIANGGVVVCSPACEEKLAQK